MRILILPLVLCACGKPAPVPPEDDDLTTHEAVTEAHIAAMNDMMDVLDGIHDRKDAEEARPRMAELKKRMETVNAAEAALPAPNPAERERLDERLKEAARRLEPQFERTMERLKGDAETLTLVAQMMIDVTFESRR